MKSQGEKEKWGGWVATQEIPGEDTAGHSGVGGGVGSLPPGTIWSREGE